MVKKLLVHQFVSIITKINFLVKDSVKIVLEMLCLALLGALTQRVISLTVIFECSVNKVNNFIQIIQSGVNLTNPTNQLVKAKFNQELLKPSKLIQQLIAHLAMVWK